MDVRGNADVSNWNGENNAHRRYSESENRWIHGTIRILEDEVLFNDAPTYNYREPPSYIGKKLAKILTEDPMMRIAVRDDRFAAAMQFYIANYPLAIASDEQSQHATLYDLYLIPAIMRGRGEFPGDFPKVNCCSLHDMKYWRGWYLQVLKQYEGPLPLKRVGFPRDHLEDYKLPDSPEKMAHRTLGLAEERAYHLRNADVMDALEGHLERLGFKLPDLRLRIK